MAPVAAMPMSKDKIEFCTYSPTKIDSQVLPLVKAAAALMQQNAQEWLSNVANEAASKQLARTPIKRRPPKPRG